MGRRCERENILVGGQIGGLDLLQLIKLGICVGQEGCGLRVVAVKFNDRTKNSDGEGSMPENN